MGIKASVEFLTGIFRFSHDDHLWKHSLTFQIQNTDTLVPLGLDFHIPKSYAHAMKRAIDKLNNTGVLLNEITNFDIVRTDNNDHQNMKHRVWDIAKMRKK